MGMSDLSYIHVIRPHTYHNKKKKKKAPRLRKLLRKKKNFRTLVKNFYFRTLVGVSASVSCNFKAQEAHTPNKNLIRVKLYPTHDSAYQHTYMSFLFFLTTLVLHRGTFNHSVMSDLSYIHVIRPHTYHNKKKKKKKAPRLRKLLRKKENFRTL